MAARGGRPTKDQADSAHRVRLTASVGWWEKTGTLVTWYWEDEDRGTWSTSKPFYQVSRKGFEVRTPLEALEALRGCSTVVEQMIRAAQEKNAT